MMAHEHEQLWADARETAQAKAALAGGVAIATQFDPPIPCELFVGLCGVMVDWRPELTAEQAAPAIHALWQALEVLA